MISRTTLWRTLALAISVTLLPLTIVQPAYAAAPGYTFEREWQVSSSVWEPETVAVGPNGRVYVFVDENGISNDSTMRSFTKNGKPSVAWSMDDKAYAADVGPDGNLYIAQGRGLWGTIGVYNPRTGKLLRTLELPAIDSRSIWSVYDVAVAPSGRVYVIGSRDEVVMFNADGSFRGTFGASGVGAGQLSGPLGVAVAKNGTVYVVDNRNSRVQYFSANGKYRGQWGTAGIGKGKFSLPRGVEVTPNGHVVVIDGTERVQEFTATGTYVRTLPTDRLYKNRDIAAGPDGSLYIAGYFASLVKGVAKFASATKVGSTTKQKVKVTKKKVTVTKNQKKARVSLKCTSTVKCHGTVTVHVKKAKGKVLAHGTFSVKPGKKKVVKVTLTKAGTKRLANAPVRAVVVLKPQGQKKVTHQVRLVN